MNTKNRQLNLKTVVKELYKDLVILIDRIENHHLFMIASGIAFNIIIYFIPLFLLMVYVVSKIYTATDLSIYIKQLFKSFLPHTRGSYEIINTVILEVDNIFSHSGFFGFIGFVGLLWISSILIAAIRTGLNVIFEIETKKIFIFYRLRDILLTIILTILVFIYSYVIPIISLFTNFLSVYVPDFIEKYINHTILLTVSISASYIIFYFIYKFLPNKKLPKKVAFRSTIISVILIEIARYVFAWYITKISDYGKFYGTYGVIIALALWIYYFALIILISAEVSKFVSDKKNNLLEK